jgi:hypothetical protein
LLAQRNPLALGTTAAAHHPESAMAPPRQDLPRSGLGQASVDPQLQTPEVTQERRAPERRDTQDERDLDPLARVLANNTLLTHCHVPLVDTTGALDRLERVRAEALQDVFVAAVRKASWWFSPDRRTVSLRLEIGAGRFAGTTVLITADPREVLVELDAPPDIDLEAWKSRLRHRLASQGLIASIS